MDDTCMSFILHPTTEKLFWVLFEDKEGVSKIRPLVMSTGASCSGDIPRHHWVQLAMSPFRYATDDEILQSTVVQEVITRRWRQYWFFFNVLLS